MTAGSAAMTSRTSAAAHGEDHSPASRRPLGDTGDSLRRGLRSAPLGAPLLGVALAVGVTLGSMAPLVELRNAAVLLAGVLPLALTDAAASVTDATPVPLWRRRLRRLSPAVGLVVLAWVGVLMGSGVPAAVAVGATVELVGLGASGLGLAALGARRGWPHAQVSGAAAAWGLAALGAVVPDAVGLWPLPTEPRWDAVHLVWALIALAGAATCAISLRDPARPHRRRPTDVPTA